MTTALLSADLTLRFHVQIFSFREIKKRGRTKDPRVQLLLLQEAEPAGAAERPGHHQPAVSVTSPGAAATSRWDV